MQGWLDHVAYLGHYDKTIACLADSISGHIISVGGPGPSPNFKGPGSAEQATRVITIIKNLEVPNVYVTA